MPGPRVYTIAEVRELVPRLSSTFAKIEAIKKKLRMANIRANALELIWGARVHEPDCPDHLEFLHHLEEMKELEDEVEAFTRRISRLGGQVRSVEPARVDFYGVRDGRLVQWCWTCGEKTIEHWHHVDEGFTGRQTV
jgi:hypothetical protein